MSGYPHTTIAWICMSTHKATAARCLHDHQAWSGQLPSGIATGPFKKARPKRALHHRDYQLPDHLYRLRENSNKRHTPNTQDKHRCIPTIPRRGPLWIKTLNAIKSQKHKNVKHPHFLWCTRTSFIFLKGRWNQKQKIICARTRFCFLLDCLKLLLSIDGKIHCQNTLLNPNKILIIGEFSEIASSAACTEKQPSLYSSFTVLYPYQVQLV